MSELVTVSYITPDGTTRSIDAGVGQSVMDAAIKNGVPGIVAECGGSCACATCHVYVLDGYFHVVGGPGVVENDMLEGTASPRLPESRLSCQIKMRKELEGLTVRIAPEQV